MRAGHLPHSGEYEGELAVPGLPLLLLLLHLVQPAGGLAVVDDWLPLLLRPPLLLALILLLVLVPLVDLRRDAGAGSERAGLQGEAGGGGIKG
jgi:hypothetical protein